MNTITEEERKKRKREYERAYYHKNREKYLKAQKAWRDKNKEKIREKDRRYRLKNPEYHKNYYFRNKQRIKKQHHEHYSTNKNEILAKVLPLQRERRKQIKKIILKHYGGDPPKCACCGEAHIEFLTIDHIQGAGNKQRRELFGGTGGGDRFYSWLIKNNFPDGFQVLCRNCNGAKEKDEKRFCPVHHPEEYVA
jgi:hypothetical protein